jgi:hypothetical protein
MPFMSPNVTASVREGTCVWLRPRSIHWLFALVTILIATACKDTQKDTEIKNSPATSGGRADGAKPVIEERDSGSDGSLPTQPSSDKDLLECPRMIWSKIQESASVDSPYEIAISRKFDTDFEEKLITEAERVAPRRNDIAKYGNPSVVNAKECVPNFVEGSSQTEDAARRRWCGTRFDCTCIAYAITCEALQYYFDVTMAYRKNEFSSSSGIRIESSTVAYLAEVKFYDSFEYRGEVYDNAYVVHLRLSWGQYCGDLCGLGFEKERFVIFNSDGTRRAILGDGPPSIVVS